MNHRNPTPCGARDAGRFRARTRLTLAALAALALAAQPAGANAGARADVQWLNPAGGVYSAGSNWSAGAPPGPLDAAVFAIDVLAPVRLDAPSAVAALRIPSGSLDLDLDGRTLSALSATQTSLLVGQTGAATLSLRAGAAQAVSAEFASVTGAPATLALSDAASLDLALDLTLARRAPAALLCEGGSSLTVGRNAFFALLPGSSAIVSIDGPGSALHCARDIQLGIAGNAHAIVSDGAQLSAEDLQLSFSSVSDASLTVTGAGSRVDTIFRLSAGAGFLADGLITIENGAQAQCGFFILAESSGSLGRAVIQGAESRLDSLGPAYVGLRGHAELLVQDGAELTSDFVWLGQYNGSSAQARLTGAGTGWTVERYLDLAREPGTTATLTLDSGAALEADVITIGAGGALIASGVIDADIDNAAGVISPGAGPDGAPAVGALTVRGDLSLSTPSTLEIDARAAPFSPHDRLTVHGHAALAGTLRVRFDPGFTPSAGVAFAFLSADSIEGAFDAVEAVGLPEGMELIVAVSGGHARAYVSDPASPAAPLTDLIDAALTASPGSDAASRAAALRDLLDALLR